MTLFDEPPSGPHWASELMASVPYAEAFDQLAALPPSSVRLPQEDDAPDFGWDDNVGRSVVAKRCDRGQGEITCERLFATMQWRHDTSHGGTFGPVVGIQPTSNGICRIQLTTNTVDRLATVWCSPNTGSPLTSVHSVKFGNWLVCLKKKL